MKMKLDDFKVDIKGLKTKIKNFNRHKLKGFKNYEVNF